MIKRFFTNNLLLKFISLLLAFFLWIGVVNSVDPPRSVEVSGIPVEFVNEDYFEQKQQYAELDTNLRISVLVSGKRSRVEGLSASDFRAYADLSMTDLKTGNVVITVLSTRSDVTVQRKSQNTIPIHVVDLITVDFPISLKVEGEPVENHFILPNDPALVLEPTRVSVTGPKNLVEEIRTAQVTVNAAGVRETISGKGKNIQFLNMQGEEIDLDEKEAITVSARLMTQLTLPVYEHREIPIVLGHIQSEDADAYYVDAVKLSDEVLPIYAPEEVFEELTQIQLPQVSLEEKTASFSQIYNVDSICSALSQQYHTTVGVLENAPEEITLTVSMKKKGVRLFTIIPENMPELIRMENGREGFSYLPVQEQIEIRLMGVNEVLSQVSEEDLLVHVELDGLDQTGVFEAPIRIDLPEKVIGVTLPETIRVQVSEDIIN